MDKVKKFFKSPASAILLFVVAGALILTGGIGGTIAWVNNPIYSDYYAARIEMKDIGVTLRESNDPNAAGEMVSHRDYIPESKGLWDTEGSTYRLCDKLLGTDEEVKIGKRYNEILTVYNSGTIDEYVRVNVYKYWAEVDENGNITTKRPDLDPSLIDLHFTETDDWKIDENTANNAERTTLYYTHILKHDEETSPFTDTLKIDDGIAIKVYQDVSQDGEYTVYTTTYDYDGLQFVIEAEVDAVQTHNAEAAMLSAWGKTITVDKNTGDIQDIK